MLSSLDQVTLLEYASELDNAERDESLACMSSQEPYKPC